MNLTASTSLGRTLHIENRGANSGLMACLLASFQALAHQQRCHQIHRQRMV
jgi:hypothetical protein